MGFFPPELNNFEFWRKNTAGSGWVPKRPTLQLDCAINRAQVSSSEFDGDSCCSGTSFSRIRLCLLFVSLCVCLCLCFGDVKQGSFCLMWSHNNAFMFTFHIHFRDGICFTAGTAAITNSAALPSVGAHVSETLITNRCCSKSRIPLSGYSAWAMSCLTWILQASWKTPQAALVAHW